MKILVTGASGFVGTRICERLAADGQQVTGLSRSSTARLPPGVSSVQGDVISGAGLAAALTGMDAVIHLVGIIRERGDATFERVHVQGTRNVVAAAEAAGVSRFVHMSALGVGSGSGSEYHTSKAQGEEMARTSDLEWTIMRPSLIFGVGDDFFAGTLRQLVTLPPLIPVVGTGEYLFRPVWLGDVATAFTRALERTETVRQTFELVGPREYTLRELLLLVRDTLQLRKPLVNVPLPLMRLGVSLFRLLPNPPITRNQFLMLLAGNTGDPAPAAAAFGLELTDLSARLPEILAAA